MSDNAHPSAHDRKWVSEVVDSYLTFDQAEHSAKSYRERNIDTLMSAIPVPNTKRATHCASCRERYVKNVTDSWIAIELDAYLVKQRAGALADALVTSAAGELYAGNSLLSAEDIQLGSTHVEYEPLRSGVYFLLSGRDVVYVGQANNVKARIRTHKVDADKVFDAYAFLPCEKEDLDTLEALYIMHLRPALNKRQPSIYDLLYRTRKMPLNLKLPDTSVIDEIVAQESTE